MSGEMLLRATGIRKRFQTLEVLKGIDLSIPQGEIVTIVGPSGAGKTTLLQIVGTLLAPDSGEVYINGREVTGLGAREQAAFRNREIGFVFQFHHLLPEFTALENVCLPAMIDGLSLDRAKVRAKELLDFMGLTARLDHKPAELSGGEQQRVAVARALINDPPLLLADEPTGNLDSENREELHALFFNLRDQMGKSFLIVTHDDSLAQRSDRVIRMQDGLVRLVESMKNGGID